MQRENLTVRLPEGEVLVKRCSYGDIVKYYPEYESLKTLAAACGQDIRCLSQRAAQAARDI